MLPEDSQEAIVIGNSRTEIRTKNGVRSMLVTEDGQIVSGLLGIYGFAAHLSVSTGSASSDRARRLRPISGVRLRREHSIANEIELHVLGEDRVMAVVNVSEGDAARLANPMGDVGEIFGFSFDTDEARR